MKSKINLIIFILAICLFVIATETVIFAHVVVQKADMPTKRAYHASCVINDIIYVFGGWSGYAVTSVEAYDPSTDKWTKKTDMPIGKYAPAVCEINGIAYVIGGATGTEFLSSVEAYDPMANTWTKKANMPTPRDSFAVGVVNGIIYAIGGYSYGLTGAVEAYDPSTNTWTKKADMPNPRQWLTSAVVNGLIYVIGGMSLTAPVPDAFDVYDPSTDKWVKKTIPFTNAYTSACVMDNLIYIMEGWSNSYNMVYDPATDVWKKLSDRFTITDGNTCNVVNGKIYVIGGFVNHANEYSGAVYEHDLSRAPKQSKKDKIATLWGSVKVND